MNSIKLTEEHKSKLLEMCKALFPKYKIWDLKLNGEYRNYLIASFEEENDYIPNCDLYIHWFEFCMTYLPVELYRYAMHKCNINPADALKIITINLTQFVDFGRYEINPVDYLYEQFKTLK
jgi:hypothetical protein